MLSSGPPLVQDGYIETYNLRLEEYGCMKEYRSALLNGSLASDSEPPLPRLKLDPQALFMGKRKHPDIRSSMCIPVEFWVIKGSDSGTVVLKGLKLTDAIEGDPEGLCRPSQSVWDQSTRTFVRLRVNGYADHGEQVPYTGEFARRYDMKLADVAEKVAAIVKCSMLTMNLGVAEVHQWRMPNGDIVRFEDLVLLELRHVTAGSWQPVLAYADPSSRWIAR